MAEIGYASYLLFPYSLKGEWGKDCILQKPQIRFTELWHF